ncbi:hypothetical protein [Cribrihabitans neustonicus]|uniref:hypothetical protein n=1 Tax=Cribrihabitans neustonicus TaxID=1429085 RepID=UPI003B59F835
MDDAGYLANPGTCLRPVRIKHRRLAPDREQAILENLFGLRRPRAAADDDPLQARWQAAKHFTERRAVLMLTLIQLSDSELRIGLVF